MMSWITPEVQALFDDPRFKHLKNMGDLSDDEPERVGYDRMLTLQAAAAIYSMQSAEKHSKSLAKATWGLFFATVGLVIATIVLVVVTVNGG